MYARDCSNYSDLLTPEVLDDWRAEGVGLVIIQAFPPTYTQYRHQRAQMSACATAGMPFDSYIYDYLGDPTWLWGALDGLDTAATVDLKPRQLWLDEEDTETEAGWSSDQRESAISNNLLAVMNRGYTVDIYTADWWWTPRVGSDEFSDHKLWAAQYDGVADASVFTPFGGWTSCRIKQYAGTQTDGTDLNVLSAEEETELTQSVDCQIYKDALERVVNRIQIEDERKTASGQPAPLRRTVIREIASEAYGALVAQ